VPRWTTAALQVETVEVVRPPFRAPTDALMTTGRARPEQRNAFWMVKVRRLFKLEPITMSKLCLSPSSNAGTRCNLHYEQPSRCPNSRLIVANIVSRSGEFADVRANGETSGPQRPLSRACSVVSFKRRWRSRAPRRDRIPALRQPDPAFPR